VNEVDVAIIIVSYKSAALTIDCVRSIEAERSSPGLRIRVVVVDNASGDAPPIARAIEENGWSTWVTLVVAERNGGFAYGNNLGFRRAYADGPPVYLHLLNPDTILKKGAILKLVAFMESHPEVGIAGGSFENRDGSDWPIAFRFPSLLGELDAGLQIGFVSRWLGPVVVAQRMSPVAQPTDWVAGASMMIRRAVLETVGGLDENYFLYFEETDLCFRARAAGFSTWYVPESRVMHIGGQSTKVTERNAKVKRLPDYWFESRRRFFRSNYGLRYAMAADAVALLAHSLGHLKRVALRRGDEGVPWYIRDLARHSILRTPNRRLPAQKCFPPRAGG
jgi:GT2 family glycosyltransferase